MQRCPLVLFLFEVIQKWYKIGTKVFEIGKKEVKLSVFAEDTILYIENPEKPLKLLELITKFNNLQDTKSL